MRMFSYLTLLLLLGACDQKSWGDESWLNKYPDAKIVETVERGSDARIITLPSKVVITQYRDKDGKLSSMSQDLSGHGAVLCMKMMMPMIRAMVEACPMKDKALFLAEMDKANERIDDFIMANSITPVTKKELIAQHKKEYAQMKKNVSEDAETQKQCKTKRWKREMPKMRAEFKKQIDDLLSVPRPPVLNPCL